jgi:ABC-2 type transport system permease protein
MNLEHLKAFLWLRWRLRLNQLRRGGIANAVVLGIIAVGVAGFGLALFVGSFLLGWLLLPNPKVPSFVTLIVWAVLLVFYLLSSGIGLLTDLQRSDVLSLDKFLHLPVSLWGAFLINYLSSLVNLSLLLFLPAMVGLTLGMVLGVGLLPLLMLPLIVAFFLAITALTYQFQGWLATLVANPRRRRTVIVLATLFFVLVCQIPNLINLLSPWGRGERPAEAFRQQQQDLTRQLQAKEITPQEYQRRFKQWWDEYKEQRKEKEEAQLDQFTRTARWVCLCVPPGWLALAAMDLAEGKVLVALLATAVFAAVGAGSLRMSYRATLRYFTGDFKQAPSDKAALTDTKRPATLDAATPVGLAKVAFLEKRLPWLSEQASVIALASFRHLLRAPEAKMLLLTPVLMILIFGALLFRNSQNIPPMVRPLMSFGATTLVLFSMTGLLGNQFGFDRGGFRIFVLSPVPRKDILLGKNLSAAPLVLVLTLVILIPLEIIAPMRVDHLLATLPQMGSMFLLYCLLANLLSILAPVPVQPGSFKPKQVRGMALLLYFAFSFLFPLALVPALLPLGVELGMEALGWVQGVPIALGLSLLGFCLVGLLYHHALNWEGQLLLWREQKILDVVARPAE